MNSKTANNFAHIKVSSLGLPIFLLALIVLFLYFNDVSTALSYSEIQKEWFFLINEKLSKFPHIIYNLTQLGDALVSLSILSVLLLNVPKIWETLISSSLFSLIFSIVLKNLFSIPRPAATLDTHHFVIIGKTLSGHSSLPSGHSITVFTILTVLLYALIPKKLTHKFLWISTFLVLGFSVAFTRVGVGAHYPLDVIIGIILGYISGLLGILVINKYNIFGWISYKKYYPFFMMLFLACLVVLLNKILTENLVIFYIAFVNLLYSFYKITAAYVQK